MIPASRVMYSANTTTLWTPVPPGPGITRIQLFVRSGFGSFRVVMMLPPGRSTATAAHRASASILSV